eukprot:6625433-Heterocapsa_arctica.AAC.1
MGPRTRTERRGSSRRRSRGVASRTGWGRPPETKAGRRESAIRPRVGDFEDHERGGSRPGRSFARF